MLIGGDWLPAGTDKQFCKKESIDQNQTFVNGDSSTYKQIFTNGGSRVSHSQPFANSDGTGTYSQALANVGPGIYSQALANGGSLQTTHRKWQCWLVYHKFYFYK